MTLQFHDFMKWVQNYKIKWQDDAVEDNGKGDAKELESITATTLNEKFWGSYTRFLLPTN